MSKQLLVAQVLVTGHLPGAEHLHSMHVVRQVCLLELNSGFLGMPPYCFTTGVNQVLYTYADVKGAEYRPGSVLKVYIITDEWDETK